MKHPKPGLSRLPVVIAALLAGASLGAQAQSLVNLYESARAFDATYLAARLQYEANLARAEQNKAGVLPRVGVTAGANYNHFDISSSSTLSRTFPNQTAGVSASHPLYNPASQAAFDQASKQVEVARAQLESAEQDLIVRTSQAYFDVLAAQDTVASVRAQRAALEEQLAAAKRRFEVGTSTIVDTRQAQAGFDRIVATQIQAENDLTVRRIALDQLVGKNGTQPLSLVTPAVLTPVPPTDINAWVQRAETLHPNVRAALNNVDIARLEVARAEAGHKPTVDLTASYSYGRNPQGNFTSTVSSSTKSAVLGVSLNLPLFAGYATQNRIRETLALADRARTDLEGARRTVALNTRQAFFGVVSSQGRVRALEAAELSTQSLVDSTRLGYQVGVTINLDVLDAQSQLFQTRRDLAVARYEVLVGNLRLRQASGVLVPQDLEPINTLLVKP